MKLVDGDTSLFEEEQAARFKSIIDARQVCEQRLLEAQADLAAGVLGAGVQEGTLELIGLIRTVILALNPA